MMLGGLANVNVSDVNTVQELVRQLGGGMSTALYTTLSGLICGTILKIQCFNASDGLKRLR